MKKRRKILMIERIYLLPVKMHVDIVRIYENWTDEFVKFAKKKGKKKRKNLFSI